jgi:hypothetical protein
MAVYRSGFLSPPTLWMIRNLGSVRWTTSGLWRSLTVWIWSQAKQCAPYHLHKYKKSHRNCCKKSGYRLESKRSTGQWVVDSESTGVDDCPWLIDNFESLRWLRGLLMRMVLDRPRWAGQSAGSGSHSIAKGRKTGRPWRQQSGWCWTYSTQSPYSCSSIRSSDSCRW